MPPTFTLADPIKHRAALLALNLDYMQWVGAGIEQAFGASPLELHGMPLPDYVAGMLAKLCAEGPPRGVFYLVESGGALAGMGGLRRLRADVAEVKRLYVRPQSRGAQLGAAILQRLLADAARFGYRSVVLDSAPFMQAAQRLYERAGFVDCAPYAESEVPAALHGGWRFMEQELLRRDL